MTGHEILMIDGRFNNLPAFGEGWGLLRVTRVRHRIERLDFPPGCTAPLFVSDREALEHVQRMAAGGSQYHAAALAIHLEMERSLLCHVPTT